MSTHDIYFAEYSLSIPGVPGPHSRAGKENGRESEGDTMIPHVCESNRLPTSSLFTDCLLLKP